MYNNQNSLTNNVYPKAPKDIFERNYIGYKDGKRILCKEIKEVEDDQEYILMYTLDNTVQIEPFISMLRAFETDDICLAECLFCGYDSDDYPLYYGCRSIEEVYGIYDSFPNPCVDFTAYFCDRETKKYRFSLVTSINAKSLFYEVEAKKFNNCYSK